MSVASAIPAIGDAFATAKKGSKGLGIAAKVGKGAVKGLKDCGTVLKCFTAGTKVSTVDGQKNIEDIKKGRLCSFKGSSNRKSRI